MIEHEEKNRTNGSERNDEPQKPNERAPISIAVAIVVAALIGALLYWIMTHNQESTDDDDYTEGNAISIASKVSGYVIENHVNDNARVKGGDLLVKIDPRDYVSARDRAQADLDASIAQLTSDEIDLEVAHVRAPANLAQARGANLKAASAQVTVASLIDQAIRSAEAVVELRKAQVEEARAKLSQAELNLSYTEIRAPQDGLITQRNVNLGTFVQVGQQMFYLVTGDIRFTVASEPPIMPAVLNPAVPEASRGTT